MKQPDSLRTNLTGKGMWIVSAGFTIVFIGVLKHRSPLSRAGGGGVWAHLPAKKIVYDGFLLMWCNFKF